MHDICFILVVVMAVGVAVKAEYRRSVPGPFPPIPPPLMNVTTCAATSCLRGLLCRIVLKTDGSLGPLCLDPSDVPRRGSTRVCGSSGHPLLVERTSRRGRSRYSQFRLQRGQQCPEDLVKRFSACCAETEKQGACPPADNVNCRRRSCRGDNQCQGDQKCCQSSCGKSTCSAPITSKTVCSSANCIAGVPCAILDCAPGFFCVESPDGPKCERETPVTCALIDCFPDFTCIDFPNGSRCVPLNSTCAVVLCPVGSNCVEAPSGATCEPATQKPGFCPLGPVVGFCDPRIPTCQTDADCADDKICCELNCRRGTCETPVSDSACASVTCRVGDVCVDTRRGPECRSVNKPGACPPLLVTREEVGVCAETCRNDSSCADEQKCCPTVCGGLTCADPVPPPTCAAILCLVGTICVETPNGAECRAVEKPGECPPPLPTGEGVGVCARTCQNDSSCDGTQKCCPTLCGGLTCNEAIPPATCAAILCIVGTVCVETPNGAECQPAQKPGMCPSPLSLRQETGVCAESCQNDASCDDDQKCCRTVCGGLTCADPIPPLTCASALCIKGSICVETPSGPECRQVDKPGVCPVPPPDSVGICAFTCDSDLNCTGIDKCCRTACGGRTCVQVLTCATVKCAAGNVCINTPTGPECRLVNKPGNCPVPGPDGVGNCNVTCENDASCRGTDKCCRTACGGTTCTPVITCANVLCARETPFCVETDEGPRCIVQKPGICPIFPCPPPPVDLIPSPALCVDQCQEDNDCEGARKCCNGCSRCRSCFDPFELPSLCDSVECGLGEVCRLEQVVCATLPCLPVPTCVPIGSTVGQCPATTRETVRTCSYECETDGNCGPGAKCCLTACGGTVCTTAVPVSTCDTVRCGSGQVCREIYDPDFDRVYPQCVDEPREGPMDVCEIGLPLLLATEENNTAVFCGRGFDSRPCPQGYFCNVHPLDLYAFCCRTTSPIPKPGECPPPVGFGICAFTCKDDNSCQGAQKCCRTACSGTQCQNPVTNVTKDGVCPPVLCAENPRICIVNQCETDSDCTGNQKCCDGCGCRRCFTPILLPTGCDSVICPKGQRCVENDGGTECVPIEKPGICPQLRCADRVCEGRNACRADGDCRGDLKCCKGCSGCMECLTPSLLPTPPPPSCLTVRCSADTECVETAEGPKCLPLNAGTCPRLTCSGSVPQPCVSSCEADSDCEGDYKCCEGCSGCSKCVVPAPLDPLLCGSQTCQPGEECRKQTIFCITTPCPEPFFTCVSTAISEGQCPTARPPLNSTCVDQCSFDQECARGEKCCSTLCGATACTETVRPATCDTARCPSRSQTCREVYDMDTVTPNCFENPLETLQDAECRVGLPLLLRNFPGGEITQANCGQERDAITCPDGYSCQIGPGGAFSVCCRDEEQQCNPPCGPGTTCVTTPINCLVPPCPPTPRCEATDTTDICQLPSDTGPCRAALPRFFFNSASQQCETFTYGGCDGNDNRFLTLAACIATCANDTCSLPKVVGPCEALIPSYFYNSDSGQCESFNYGGCQGNSNRFSSRADCLDICSAIEDKCLLPPDRGPCRAAFPNFFFNPETNDCEEFTYGGCGGNDNRFSSREACIQECAPDICSLPADAGPCEALEPSYYFDTQSNSCKAFNYGGCQGNANRFPRFRSCEQACRVRRRRYLG